MNARPHLIETLRVEPGGVMPLLDGHLKRLEASCHALGYDTPELERLSAQLTRRAASLPADQAWRMRLLVAPDGDYTIEHGALLTPEGPLPVIVTGPRAPGDDFWLQHKTTRRPWYAAASAWLATQPDVFDVLFWNGEGRMSEGSRSNLYMQAPDGRWLTPPLDAGALPGVQRAALLEAGRVHEADISRDMFLGAKAHRISNALRGWRDAVIVERPEMDVDLCAT